MASVAAALTGDENRAGMLMLFFFFFTSSPSTKCFSGRKFLKASFLANGAVAIQ